MASHIVHKQQVTLNLPKREEAHAFQNRVSDLLRNELCASMEAVFDELFPTTDSIRIDSLVLDLGKIEALNFEQEFKTHFIEELRKNLSSKKSKQADENTEEVLRPEQSLIKAFIYFLENGYLPWYSPVENMADWSNEILTALSEKKDPYFFNWLSDNYVDEPIILQRLILQYDNVFLTQLISIISPATDESWNAIYRDLEIFITNCTKKHLPVRNEIWKYIFHALLSPHVLENKIALSVTKDKELILQSLSLLANHFNISSHEITTSMENRIKQSLKTNIVKQAFQDLKSLLISEEGFRQDMDDHMVTSKHRETEVNNTYNKKKEIITDKLKGNTEESSTYNEEEEITTNKSENNSETNRAKNIDSININKGKKTHKVETDDTHDITNKPNDICKEKTHKDTGQRNVREEKTHKDKGQKNVREEKIKEEHENHKIHHSDNQVEILSRQREIQAERFNKNKKENNTGQFLPNNKKHTGIIEAETLYIKNSGIVILHYFLSPYFNDLGLLADGKFIDDTTHQRAVLLLHYLATGKIKAAEFDLTLSKILCGYPIQETLPAVIILTKKEKAESKRLLEAIIDHWSPLKNTSVKGLRNAFFERDGTLTKKENGWLLTVEQRTIDVLLGKLPWGYSTIRLPWMQEILNVDWY
ncbi:hypothetical protein SAMN05428975_3690 [Mucilaginibacter sp. OK268]|uniref:contractile injection system tape measure protein n=1 Tax=Mucilaginibacter sp. OK268 TaxID=1881048 RepID=UPI000889311E|nr:contractile injection system tape measure protein [Mucilaginibacter sp. OK268]SDP92487.1 hypothetical protein SAMN05428975_3690 [Mucilaginibacter sp. OK268]